MEKEKQSKKGKLYIVSTHIGNKEDITLRAMRVLKLCDIVICEELKIGAQILRDLSINKKLDTINEQNETEKVFDIIELIKSGKKIALISDCGTPVFADPGAELVQNAIISEIEVVVVPGVSSLMTAIVRSGMSLNQFLYAGFLERNSDERVQQLQTLAKEKRTVVLYDTPYRLLPLLEDACKIMPHRRVYLGMNLTMPYETHHYSTFKELYEKFKNERIKAEFVIVFEGLAHNAAERKDTEIKQKADFRKFDKFDRKTPVRVRTGGRNNRFSPAKDGKYPDRDAKRGKNDRGKFSRKDNFRDKNRSKSYDRSSKKEFSKQR